MLPFIFRCRWGWTLLPLLVLAACGCAKGPLWQTGYVAPWALKRWAEEERFAQTLHAKRENLRATVRSAARGTPADQEHAAQQLVEIINTSPIRLERIEAVTLLGQLDSPTAESGLLRAAQDPSSEVRLAAVHACGSKSNVASLRTLQEILGADTDVDVRIAAARQLQNFPEPGAIQALALALDDKNSVALQIRAADSLQALTGQKFGHDLAAWREYAQSAAPPASPTERVADQLPAQSGDDPLRR